MFQFLLEARERMERCSSSFWRRQRGWKDIFIKKNLPEVLDRIRIRSLSVYTVIRAGPTRECGGRHDTARSISWKFDPMRRQSTS